MSRWPMVPLGEIVTIVGGGTPDRNNPSYWGGSIPWASVKDFRSTRLESTVESITHEGVVNSATNVIPASAVLVPTRMAVGKAAINTVAVAINQDLKALTPKASIDARYLLHSLLANAAVLERQATGATVKGITLDVLRALELPLPPMNAQRRIAAILDQADTLRRLQNTCLARVCSLPAKLFEFAFGDLIQNERNWSRGKVADLVAGFESGKSLVADDVDDAASQFRVLKISAVTSLRFRPEEAKALPSDYTPPAHHLVRTGDVLFSRANTSDLVGATALVEGPLNGLVLPDKLWRICWHRDPRTDPLFVWQLFMQRSFRDAVRRRSTGSSGSMKNVSQGNVLAIEIGLPPLDGQIAFARRFAELRQLETLLRARAAHLDTLFASLQHRAFNGELTSWALERELAAVA